MISFYQYFEGSWQVTDLATQSEGSMTIELGTGGACHIMRYQLGDIQRTELWGYDPATKQWRATGFGQDGERFSQVMLDAPSHRTPQAGDRWVDQHEGMLPSGEKTSSHLEIVIESEDVYLVEFTKNMCGEQSLPDSALRIVRQ